MRRRRKLLLVGAAIVVAALLWWRFGRWDRTSVRIRRQKERVLPSAILMDEEEYVSGERGKWSLTDPYQRHAFNVEASNGMRSDRPLPDTRPHRCRALTYDEDLLPRVTVIIAFHNEARSTLLRTILSVLNRTPASLIDEIILVDDYSDDAQDGELLQSLPKVRLLRNQQREGLIRSRVVGSDEAKAECLVFLDSHCEVNVDWLQPLLVAIVRNPKTVASPVMDVIDIHTFQYRGSATDLKGGFDWSLRFKWIPLTLEEKSALASQPTLPFKSPVIAGGLLAIDREWFQWIGKYDQMLDVWGAENFEISFKTWLCGGSLEIVPCSRVGHVFRDRHPYTFPDGNAHTYLRNSRRIAEVWLDEYKRFFYEARPNARHMEIGSVEKEKEVRQRLACKPFQWFIDVIYPDLRMPNGDAVGLGQFKQGDMCLDTFQVKPQSPVILTSCSNQRPSQEWSFSKDGLLRNGNSCLSSPVTSAASTSVIIARCELNDSQRWSRRGRFIIHITTGLCLDNDVARLVIVAECIHNAFSQQWDFSIELQSFQAMA